MADRFVWSALAPTAGSACLVKVVLFTGEARHCAHMCAIIIRSMNRRNRREAAGCRTDTIRKKCRAAGRISLRPDGRWAAG